MQIFWTLKSIPELSNISSAELNKRWLRVIWKTYRHWPTWVGLIACGCMAGVGSVIGSSLGHSMIGTGIGGGIGGFIFSQTMIGVARRNYMTILLGKDSA